jgi:hypothetical protein
LIPEKERSKKSLKNYLVTVSIDQNPANEETVKKSFGPIARSKAGKML